MVSIAIMGENTGHDVEASELRQRQTKGSSTVTGPPQAASVESLDTENGADDDKPKAASKTYGRTPDGTSQYYVLFSLPPIFFILAH
jgi:hypothetical protein